jgi:hypothetical protein
MCKIDLWVEQAIQGCKNRWRLGLEIGLGKKEKNPLIHVSQLRAKGKFDESNPFEPSKPGSSQSEAD